MNPSKRTAFARQWFLLVMMTLFTALIPACSHKPAGQASLLVGVMPSMDYLPLAVALREGYYAASGLNLTLVKFYSANERDAALQSGQVDGVVIDYTGVVLQKNGGLDLRLTSRCDAPFYIMAGPKSALMKPEDLKNAKIAVARNTVIDYCVDRTLIAAGLTPEDVQKVEINKIPLRFEMLMSGSVDATGLPDPLALLSQAEGGRILNSNTSLGISITGIAFSGGALAQKSALIKKMYAGYNQGVEYLSKHNAEDIHDILEGQMGFTPRILPSARLPRYARASLPPEEDLRGIIAWLAGRGLVDGSLEPRALLDGSCLPE